jgi:hypothetical protein
VQAAHDRHIKHIVPQFLARLAEWFRNVEGFTYGQAKEPGRRHSDYLQQITIDHKSGVGAEFAPTHLALPVGVTDDGNGLGTGSFILRHDQPAAPGLDAKYPEEIAADPDPIRASRFAAWAYAESVGRPGKNAREGLLLLPDLLPDRSSQLRVPTGVDPHPVVAADDLDLHEFLRILHRQATQPNGIEQLKDRGICAYSQP